MFISEQYKNRGVPRCYSDILGTAAIWIPGLAVLGRVLVGRHGSCTGFVGVGSEKVAFVSCYFTPNDGIHEFQETLDRLEDILRECRENIIVSGDLNARAVEWGVLNTEDVYKRQV